MTHSSTLHTPTPHRTLWRFALALVWVGLGGGSRADAINSKTDLQIVKPPVVVPFKKNECLQTKMRVNNYIKICKASIEGYTPARRQWKVSLDVKSKIFYIRKNKLYVLSTIDVESGPIYEYYRVNIDDGRINPVSVWEAQLGRVFCFSYSYSFKAANPEKGDNFKINLCEDNSSSKISDEINLGPRKGCSGWSKNAVGETPKLIGFNKKEPIFKIEDSCGVYFLSVSKKFQNLSYLKKLNLTPLKNEGQISNLTLNDLSFKITEKNITAYKNQTVIWATKDINFYQIETKRIINSFLYVGGIVSGAITDYQGNLYDAKTGHLIFTSRGSYITNDSDFLYFNDNGLVDDTFDGKTFANIKIVKINIKTQNVSRYSINVAALVPKKCYPIEKDGSQIQYFKFLSKYNQEWTFKYENALCTIDVKFDSQMLEPRVVNLKFKTL